MPLLVVGSVAFDSVETPTKPARIVLGGSAVFSPTPPAISPRCGWWAWWATTGPPSTPHAAGPEDRYRRPARRCRRRRPSAGAANTWRT